MKFARWYSIAAMLSFSLWMGSIMGCDVIENASVIDAPVAFKLNIRAKDTTLPYTTTDTIALSANSTFTDYKDRIKGAAISKLSLKLNTYLGVPNADTAELKSIAYSLKFAPEYNDNNEYPIATVENLKVKDVLATPLVLDTLVAKNAQLNNAIKNIRDRPKFIITGKYTLKDGVEGTLQNMDGTLTMTIVLKAAVL